MRWAGLPVLALAAILLMLIRNLVPSGVPATITGQAEIMDGDSIEIDHRRLRLDGIDAPERAQECQRSGRIWRCGRAAEVHLARLIGNHHVTCSISGEDKYQRLLASCHVGKRDINRSMVLDGMAVAFGKKYRAEEAAARKERQGLWAGRFERPQQWRRAHPRP